MRAAARTAVIAGTASAVTGVVRRRHNHHAGNHDTAGEATPAADITDEQLDRLERLAALRTSGALSEEEFSAAKATVLGRAEQPT